VKKHFKLPRAAYGTYQKPSAVLHRGTVMEEPNNLASSSFVWYHRVVGVLSVFRAPVFCHTGFANVSPSPRLAVPFLNGVFG